MPEKVKFCSSCVISNQRPNSVIEFKNKDNKKSGINIDEDKCEACKYSVIKKEIDWKKEKPNY